MVRFEGRAREPDLDGLALLYLLGVAGLGVAGLGVAGLGVAWPGVAELGLWMESFVQPV